MIISGADWRKIRKWLRELRGYKEGFLDIESIETVAQINKLFDKYAIEYTPYYCNLCKREHVRGKIYKKHLKHRRGRRPTRS